MCEQVVEKCPSRNVEESFKKFPDADDYQNLIISSLSGTNTSVVKIFTKIRSVVFT